MYSMRSFLFSALVLLASIPCAGGASIDLTHAIIIPKLGPADLERVERWSRKYPEIVEELERAKKGKPNKTVDDSNVTLSPEDAKGIALALDDFLGENRGEVFSVCLQILPYYTAARMQLHTRSQKYFVYLIKVNNQKWRLLSKNTFTT